MDYFQGIIDLDYSINEMNYHQDFRFDYSIDQEFVIFFEYSSEQILIEFDLNLNVLIDINMRDQEIVNENMNH
jgi:hypothetical protein